MKQQIKEMLEMQDALNCKIIGDDWRDQDIPFYRAAWVECAELIDHYGWKWWKKQEPDMAQVKLELVDIWHFILSDLLTYGFKDAEHIIYRKYRTATPEDFLRMQIHDDFSIDQHFIDMCEGFSSQCLNEDSPDVCMFSSICNTINLSFEELYRLYIAKNILNEFRQENGYNDGSYKKVIDGKEDNQVLMDIVNCYQDDAPMDYKAHVRMMLRSYYSLNCPL